MQQKLQPAIGNTNLSHKERELGPTTETVRYFAVIHPSIVSFQLDFMFHVIRFLPQLRFFSEVNIKFFISSGKKITDNLPFHVRVS